MKNPFDSILLVTLFFLPLEETLAQIVETKLTYSDGQTNDGFAQSVSISGNFALMGALWDDNENGEDAGAAYVFRYDGSTWTDETKLTASRGSNYDKFGCSVSLSGDYALIGAYQKSGHNGTNAGAAFVFHYNGSNWVEEAILDADDGSSYDEFGYSVSLSGDYALISAINNEVRGLYSGSAYVFHRDEFGWTQQAKLIGSDVGPSHHFGYSVSISGDCALVGMNELNESSEYAYVFRFDGSGWVEEAKLVPNDGELWDHFAQSVSVSGDYALVGAWLDDDNGVDSGSAYIFHYDGSIWSLQSKITPIDGEPSEKFGSSVSISGDYGIIGAVYDDDNGTSSGSAYIFHYDGSQWVEQLKIIASDGEEGHGFGKSVSLSSDIALVGSYRSAYVYTGFVSVCDDYTNFLTRCDRVNTVKARVVLLDNIAHSGETVLFQIDSTMYPATIVDNGVSSRASISVSGLGSGTHTVSVLDPAGCFPSSMVTCTSGVADLKWDEDDARWAKETESSRNNSSDGKPLLGNYPNPFNPTTTISYFLSKDSHVSLRVYNVLGREVMTLVDGVQNEGEYQVVLDASHLAGGVYFYRLRAGEVSETRRLLLLK